MATEPIPEPLTNQDVDTNRAPEFRASRAQIPDNGEALNAVSPPVNPTRELMSGNASPQLNRAAEAVGTTLGRLVNQARGISVASDDSGPSWKETAQRKAEEAKAKASEAVSDIQESASATYQHIKERVGETVADVKHKTSDALLDARARAREYSYKNPLQVIAGSAAAGFLAGVVLRVWRSRRYE